MVKISNKASNFRNSKDAHIYGQQKIQMKLDITMLNLFIGYLFKKSKLVNRKSLNNMKKLIDVIDEKIYENDESMEARFHFIKRVLKARIVEGMENEDLIINTCRDGFYTDEIEKIIKNLPIYKKINYDEIRAINAGISDRLQFAFMFLYKDMIYSAVERMDAGEYESLREINKELTALCRDIITETRRINVIDDETIFSLDSDTLEEDLDRIVSELKNPSSTLRTGIRDLNEILAPGFMSTRLYVILGLPGGFKSGTLMKIANDIRKYNKDIPSKKPGYRKTVLFITQENTVEESVERLFNMTSTGEDIRNFTTKQVLKLLRTEGGFTLDNEDDISIEIRYYANRTIDTNDLYTIIEDLDDEKKEVIALIHDYIKRIRPAEKGKDEKEELKNVTNELKSLAIEYKIPVITAHQLNREGAKAFDAAIEANRADIGRTLGRGNVGSSWEVVENADWACTVNIERDKSSGQNYLSFNRFKIRYRPISEKTFFSHPFDMENEMKLLDDVHLEASLSKQTLSTDFERIELSSKKGKRVATEREVIGGSEPTSLFDFSAALTGK